MSQISHDDTFSKTLFSLAEFTGKKISMPLHDIYLEALKPYGLDRVNRILVEFIKHGKFPTVVEIEDRLGIKTVEPSDEEHARLLASKILRAIEKHGCSSPSHEREAMERFTEDEKAIVLSYMSWRDWCNDDMVNYDNWSTVAAQFREYYKALKNKGRYETHQELTGPASSVVASLLDSPIQKLISEIPF